MRERPVLWSDPAAFLQAQRPDHPVLFFHPDRLAATALRFRAGFPGLVTYAVKANDSREVLDTLAAAGLAAFDVASPDEMARLCTALGRPVMHYNNPLRSVSEIGAALRFGVRSWAVDEAGELAKIAGQTDPAGHEASIRLKLPVTGGHYEFGAKFGATPAEAAVLLRDAVDRGFTPAMTFHPGSQCEDAGAWVAYIEEAAAVARRAGLRLARLNVGGGFPAHRRGPAPSLEAIFATIDRAVGTAFGADRPALVCEPGRAMVAEAYTLATRVKARRVSGAVFLNDGIYGALAEAALIGAVDRVRVLAPDGTPRIGPATPTALFGPTCDGLDRLAAPVALPADTVEGDYVLFDGMGAYSTATATRFNGYGAHEVVTIAPA